MNKNDTAYLAATEGQELIDRIARSRRRAVNWLCDRIQSNGEPFGADKANAWWRTPWALCVGGAPEVASSVMSWAEREALTIDGDLRAGPYGGQQLKSPVYHLSPLAIAAWLLSRYGLANKIMRRMRTYQDPVSGGVYDFSDNAVSSLQDNLKTCQLGIAALVTGDTESAAGVFSWLKNLYKSQPALPYILYTTWDGKIVTEFEPSEAFFYALEFQKPRQAYFHPGIAAAFLAGYYQQTDNPVAKELALKFLNLSVGGTAAQFEDLDSVQICKYGWGVAAMHLADQNSNQYLELVKMAEWFLSRQGEDGSWAPSRFSCPLPNEYDYMWKTSEHLMEISYIEQALVASDINR